MVIESPLIEQRPVGLCPLNHPALCRGFSCKTVQQRIGGAGFTAGNPESHDNKTITERNYVVAIRNEHSQNHSRERFVPVKANFHIGLNFFCAIILTTICGASGAQIVRLASPEAVVGAPPDSCRPALTGEGGRLHGKYCLSTTEPRSPRRAVSLWIIAFRSAWLIP